MDKLEASEVLRGILRKETGRRAMFLRYQADALDEAPKKFYLAAAQECDPKISALQLAIACLEETYDFVEEGEESDEA